MLRPFALALFVMAIVVPLGAQVSIGSDGTLSALIPGAEPVAGGGGHDGGRDGLGHGESVVGRRDSLAAWRTHASKPWSSWVPEAT